MLSGAVFLMKSRRSLFLIWFLVSAILSQQVVACAVVCIGGRGHFEIEFPPMTCGDCIDIPLVKQRLHPAAEDVG
jgi:hypothetical protein